MFTHKDATPPDQNMHPPENESYLYPGHYDLITPDGAITKLTRLSDTSAEAEVFIHNISPAFVGFDLDHNLIHFNIKSVLAQIGLEGNAIDFSLDKKNSCAQARIKLQAIGGLAAEFLALLPIGAHLGKLFAADERRRVRDPDYLSRMFSRSDAHGRPLLSLGGMQGGSDLILDKVEGRTIAYLTLQNGRVEYCDAIRGILPILAKSLCAGMSMREFLRLQQEWQPNAPRNAEQGELLLVRTLPLHIRTVFGRVVNELVASGYTHTSASILQPDTYASGDIYELYGESKREITDIPLEFYTLEPHREHVFFQDRDQLQACLEEESVIFDAFRSAPKPEECRAAVYVVKGDQLINLEENDWILRDTRKLEFPGSDHPSRHGLMVERYLYQQPSYPFLRAIEDDLITSQGILLTRYLSTPLMKRMFLSNMVQRSLKGIYFERPSLSGEDFFSHEDRNLLHDLYSFAIPVFWVDRITQKILQYVEREGTESGMFVPSSKVETFLDATVLGVYGSNLLEGDFEQELQKLLEGTLALRNESSHTLLNAKTPLALVTGGGPGAMEVGNRVAQDLDILSCGYIVDFRPKDYSKVKEQLQNPHVEAKMTYRLDKLVERQAEFNLDLPIFLTGGIGTDFEYALEEVRRKVGGTDPTPVLLFGSPEYWKTKITSRYRCNLESGTIKGSEWISNCFYCIQNGEQGLKVYREFFEEKLAIGKKHPGNDLGFIVVD